MKIPNHGKKKNLFLPKTSNILKERMSPLTKDSPNSKKLTKKYLLRCHQQILKLFSKNFLIPVSHSEKNMFNH